MKDITKDCVERCGFFICLKVEKSSRISRPVPDKTLVIIALGRLHTANGMFHGVDLPPGESIVVSGDKPQYFDGGKQGGGLGIVFFIKFKSTH